MSFRLFTAEDTLGAMNLYSRTAGAFDEDDLYDGYALAAHVAVALAASENVENLETAIDNRTVIGRAEGILMERFDLTPAQAFAVLRRVSQRRNVRLTAWPTSWCAPGRRRPSRRCRGRRLRDQVPLHTCPHLLRRGAQCRPTAGPEDSSGRGR